MASIQTFDWNTLAAITSILATFGALFAWFIKRTFKFGEISHRLKAVEGDVNDLATEARSTRKDFNNKFNAVNARMDKLLYALAENGSLTNPKNTPKSDSK